ncbi:MAG: Ig-like domain-containing protein [Candidatus Eisenbacteria bacterium]|uniref:Ig-like domain-containing protein n=1 Tax=Eiseniibacteriota bacterium TaxID=2212470 RepID=A0A956M2K9_UNCEI|nr:Ig-like domain-containing protein [Candidatus Eisenbacteria bacterium]
MRTRTLLPLLVVLLPVVGIGGCAKSEAPSGGPLDTDPPRVVASYPDSAALGLADLDSIAIVFSESMNHRSVEQTFQVVPPVEIARREWKDRTWILRLRAPLEPHTTYVGLLGADARDRRKNQLGSLWTFPFSTGDTLDDGVLEGTVVGQRFAAKHLWVYAWPWETPPPDTTEAGFPPPALRMGQTDEKGAFRIPYVPRDRPLRVCAFYDRDGDGQFQPLPDRWTCLPDSIALADTSAATGLVMYLTAPDEPGTVAGTVVDSSCVAVPYRDRLGAVRAERDSLLEWLEGELEARVRGRGALSRADSSRIESDFARLAREEGSSLEDSARCAQPIRVGLYASGDSLVREAAAEFRWTDVPPGIYRLRGFRDINANGVRDPGEPEGAYRFAIEVAPLHDLDDLDFSIALPAGEDPLPVPEPAAHEEPTQKETP